MHKMQKSQHRNSYKTQLAVRMNASLFRRCSMFCIMTASLQSSHAHCYYGTCTYMHASGVLCFTLVTSYYHFKALWLWMSWSIAYLLFGCSRCISCIQDMLITIQTHHKAVIILCHLQDRAAFIYVLGEIERLAFGSQVLRFLCSLTVHNSWCRGTESSNVWSKTIGAFLIFLRAWTSPQVYSALKHITANPSVFIQKKIFLEPCLLLLPTALLLSDLPVIHQFRLQSLFSLVF